MIPKLYRARANDDALTSPIYLTETVKCTASEELNGGFEIKLVLPVIYIDVISNGKIISVEVPDAYGDKGKGEQLFRIYRILKNMDSAFTVYARHVSYDLTGVPVGVFSPPEAFTSSAESFFVGKLNTAIWNMAETGTDFSHLSVSQALNNSWKGFSLDYAKNVRALIFDKKDSFIGAYGGEAVYLDKGRTVHLVSRRGADRGYRITYGVNLLGLSSDDYFSHSVSGYLPYISTENYKYSRSLPVIVGVLGSSLPYIEPLNVTDIVREKYQTFPSFDVGLKDRALAECVDIYLENNSLTYSGNTTYKVDFLMLGDTEEYKQLKRLEAVFLGDTVHVYHPEISVDITARVVKTEYDVLLERYLKAEISTTASSITETILDLQKKSDDLQRQIIDIRGI